MKTLIALKAMLLLWLLSFSQSIDGTGDQVTGLYWSPRKDAKIEIYKRGDKFFGRSVWVANPRKDTENPVTKLRSRDVQGIELLTGFSYEDGAYRGGKIYDPESGKTYDCKMGLVGNNLKVRGYIGISLFGRTELFERIK
ncbi:MAG: peptide protein [Sediminibacterium sp.]|nr:peptide protein [Sediminibacterium sp.]